MSIYGRRVPNASETPYTPADGADWADPDPTNVAGALDALAAAGGGGLSNVVDDTTPQLGGDLDVNGQAIVSVANGDINLTPDGTGITALNTTTETPILAFQKDDPTPIVDDVVGSIRMVGDNDAGTPTTFARVEGRVRGLSNGAEFGAVCLDVVNNGVVETVVEARGFGLYLPATKSILFEGGTANDFETTLSAFGPTADRGISLPDASGTLITTGNADAGAITTNSADADHLLINDGGVLKRITPANLGIGGYPNFARSFHFDGSTHLSITDAAWSGSDYTTAYTIEAFVWLQPNAAGDNVIAGQLQPGVGGNQSWLWRIDATAGVTELLVSNGVALTTYTFSIMPTPGSWTHMAVNYNGSTTATLYMNGAQVAQAVSGAIAPSSSTDPVVIGGRSDGTQRFKGQMFYVRFWSDTRTATEIADNASAVLSDLTGLDAVYLFNSDVTDSSGNGNTLTVTGTATYPVVMPPMTGS